MSQLPHERHGPAVSNGCIGIRMLFIRRSYPPHFTHTRAGNHRYPSPRTPQSRHLPGDSSLVDGSWPLFNMILGTAKEEDLAMAEGWKADAEGILFFVSAYFTVGAFDVNSGLSHCRLVYSLPSLLPFFVCSCRASCRARRVTKLLILQMSTKLAARTMMAPSLPYDPMYLPRTLRRNTLS